MKREDHQDPSLFLETGEALNKLRVQLDAGGGGPERITWCPEREVVLDEADGAEGQGLHIHGSSTCGSYVWS